MYTDWFECSRAPQHTTSRSRANQVCVAPSGAKSHAASIHVSFLCTRPLAAARRSFFSARDRRGPRTPARTEVLLSGKKAAAAGPDTSPPSTLVTRSRTRKARCVTFVLLAESIPPVDNLTQEARNSILGAETLRELDHARGDLSMLPRCRRGDPGRGRRESVQPGWDETESTTSSKLSGSASRAAAAQDADQLLGTVVTHCSGGRAMRWPTLRT
jgi:hypothetical protein